jgi:hypothetical protein
MPRAPRGAGKLCLVKIWRWALVSTLPAGALALLMACGSSFTDVAEHPDAATTEGGPAVDGSASAEGAADGSASGDAGGLACATRNDAPLMCADFDDMPTARVYSEGTPSNVQDFPNRKVRAPGASAPNGMWSETLNDLAHKLTASGTTDTTHVHVELDVFVEPWGTEKVDGALVRVGISPNLCYVEVRLQSTNLVLQTQCADADAAADPYRFVEILPNPIITAQWVHVALDVDYAISKATASLDGKLKGALDLNPFAAPGGKPYVDVGINLDKVTVGFDNVLAIATPKK